MKKPIIKNWMKYCTGTLAISGLLVMGSCGGEESTTAQEDFEATEEVVVTERENVAVTEAEPAVEAEEEVVVLEEEVTEAETVPANTEGNAYTIQNMDAHLEQHEDTNKAIKETLTDGNNQLNMGTSAKESFDQPVSLANEDEEEVSQNSQGSNPLEQDSEESNVLGEEGEIEITREIDPEAPVSIYERHIGLYSEDLSGYAKQRLDDVMDDYYERRESMRGQADEVTGIYIAPEVDPVPTIGFDDLKYQIYENIQYPRNAEAANVEGVVLVNLVVDENGEVVEVKAMDDIIIPSEENTHAPQYPKSFSEEDIKEAKEDLKREAERAVQETAGLWEAGTQNGEKVKSAVLIPINFEVRNIGVGEDEILGEEGQPVDIMD